MLGVSSDIFCTVDSSTRIEGSLRSVAITTPLVALMPSEVAPAATALSAYSIWTSLPLGLKVVSEKEYCVMETRNQIASANQRAARSGARSVPLTPAPKPPLPNKTASSILYADTTARSAGAQDRWPRRAAHKH